MYSRIIDEVMLSSQVNFEEDGVDQQTLNEMRTVGLPSFSLSLGTCYGRMRHMFRNIPLSFRPSSLSAKLSLGIILVIILVIVAVLVVEDFRVELAGRSLL